ncbi:MAG TPA: ribosome maturation factor RimP [Candidatus Acidoferrales bacterium]|nr:ribosome maturation factor RimP [Candidatus Acidoferrales bacterium]
MNNDNASVSGIADAIRPSLSHLGLDLIDVQWAGHGRGAVLRLVIDRDDGGVTLDDCERASNAASAVLDVYDPIDHAYRLEVSSPGAERPIRTPEGWLAAVGRRVNVRLREGDAELVLEGRLMSVAGTLAEIQVRNRQSTRVTSFDLRAVIAARIVVDI